MPVVKQGESSLPDSGYQQIAPLNMKAGTYILHYKAPAFTFRFLSAETLTSVIKSWFSLKRKLGATDGGGFLDIKGVTINTDTGDIFIKALLTPVQEKPFVINGQEVAAPTEAGVNPLAVLAVVAGLFAAIGIGISLLEVYEGKVAPTVAGLSIGFVAGIAITLGFLGYLILKE